MKWLREHGLVARYEDYGELPAPVLADARLLMEAENNHARATQQKSEAAAKRAERGKR